MLWRLIRDGLVSVFMLSELPMPVLHMEFDWVSPPITALCCFTLAFDVSGQPPPEIASLSCMHLCLPLFPAHSAIAHFTTLTLSPPTLQAVKKKNVRMFIWVLVSLFFVILEVSMYRGVESV